jgi:hypothetical protein
LSDFNQIPGKIVVYFPINGGRGGGGGYLRKDHHGEIREPEWPEARIAHDDDFLERESQRREEEESTDLTGIGGSAPARVMPFVPMWHNDLFQLDR